jgi:hypothetical protein
MMRFLFRCCTNVTSFGLVAEGLDHMCVGSNKSNAVVSTLLSESRILTQETVARMNHGDVVKLGNPDNLILRKVCCHWGELAGVSDLVRFIGLRREGAGTLVVSSGLEQLRRIRGKGRNLSLFGSIQPKATQKRI